MRVEGFGPIEVLISQFRLVTAFRPCPVWSEAGRKLSCDAAYKTFLESLQHCALAFVVDLGAMWAFFAACLAAPVMGVNFGPAASASPVCSRQRDGGTGKVGTVGWQFHAISGWNRLVGPGWPRAGLGVGNIG